MEESCSDKPCTVWLSSTHGAVICASTAAASDTSGSGRVSSHRISDIISTPPACNEQNADVLMQRSPVSVTMGKYKLRMHGLQHTGTQTYFTLLVNFLLLMDFRSSLHL